MRRIFFVLLLWWSAGGWASTLPNGLSPDDVGRIVNLVGSASALRLMRSAEPYLPWPGIKIGLETMIVPAYGINNLGAQDGSLPSINPIPRLYFSKGLFFNTEITFVWLPASLINTISTLGIAGRYSFWDEKEDWVSGAVFFSYTDVQGFNSTYLGNDWEIGAEVSKDYVRAKPYLGAGLLLANGSVLTDNTYVSARQFLLHAFFGIEFELPVTLTIQFDMMNLNPSGSLFFGKHF